MKTLLLSLTCVTGLVASAQAQVFQPQTARNVLIGGVVGAIIGENNHHQALEGAAIGAAAGLLWSAATERDCTPSYAPPVPVRQVCETPTRTVVVAAQPRCDQPTRTVVVCPPPPPRRVVVVQQPAVIVRQPHCAPREVVVVQPRHSHHPRRDREVVYVPAPTHGCNNAPVVVYKNNRQRGGW